MSDIFEERMKQYEAANELMEPPCYENIMVELFYEVKEGGEWVNGEYQMPEDRIKESYPEISEDDLKQLMNYLNAAEEFCSRVSSEFAHKYDYPFIPQTEEAESDALRIVKIFQNRFRWMPAEQAEGFLESYCHQANR